MTEKETFIKLWEDEFKTSVNVLNAYPAEKLELKPAEILRPARAIAWTVISCDVFIGVVLDGKIMEFTPGETPSTLKAMIAEGTTAHAAIVARLKKMPDADFFKMVQFFVGPGKMGDVPLNEVLWSILFDHIHHRGQLTIYERMAGGIVPSIYGPTAENNWM